MKRAAALLAAILAVGSCRLRPRWECRPFGNAERCQDPSPIAPAGAGFACHEWRSWLLCAAAAGVSPPGAPWRCRTDAGRLLCGRGDLAFPDGAAAAAEGGAKIWRCTRDGRGARHCRPRAFGNDAWKCEGDSCARRHTDYPNQWEWECFETQGRVICRSDTPAAADPDWTCGKIGERLMCIDPDPDFPDGDGAAWTCRGQADTGHGRACKRAAAPPCASDDHCRGGFCLDGRCVLAVLAAECFFETDCKAGKCTGGACLAM